MKIEHKYFFSKQKDIMTSIHLSEQEFHKSHAPLYANHLFCNSFAMNKIGNYLTNDCPVGTIINVFEFDNIHENQRKKLNNGALICGLELVDEKIDMEANYLIAKHSHNVFIFGFNSINDDDLLLVRDDSMSDNTYILKYIPDNDDDEDDAAETVYSPDEELIFSIA